MPTSPEAESSQRRRQNPEPLRGSPAPQTEETTHTDGKAPVDESPEPEEEIEISSNHIYSALDQYVADRKKKEQSMLASLNYKTTGKI